LFVAIIKTALEFQALKKDLKKKFGRETRLTCLSIDLSIIDNTVVYYGSVNYITWIKPVKHCPLSMRYFPRQDGKNKN
jgi:hypothetical protein